MFVALLPETMYPDDPYNGPRCMPNCSLMTITGQALVANTVKTHWEITKQILFDFSINIRIHYISRSRQELTM